MLAARGWVLALAHVRGGGELGPAWHHAGRAAHKGRSASDVLAVVRGLQAWGYCDPARTAAQADSAGALALAGALNADPSCFGAVVRAAPPRRTCCTRRMPHTTHTARDACCMLPLCRVLHMPRGRATPLSARSAGAARALPLGGRQGRPAHAAGTAAPAQHSRGQAAQRRRHARRRHAPTIHAALGQSQAEPMTAPPSLGRARGVARSIPQPAPGWASNKQYYNPRGPVRSPQRSPSSRAPGRATGRPRPPSRTTGRSGASFRPR